MRCTAQGPLYTFARACGVVLLQLCLCDVAAEPDVTPIRVDFSAAQEQRRTSTLAALAKAAYQNDVQRVRELLREEDDNGGARTINSMVPTMTGENGMIDSTVLHWAVSGNSTAAAQYLLEFGADPNVARSDGRYVPSDPHEFSTWPCSA
jgi:hypothetical protein